MIEALDAPLPVALRNEVVPSPDALWQRLSVQENIPRAEGHSQPVTWEEFLTTKKEYLQHMVNSHFNLMNEIYASIADQVSVRHQFYDHAGQYFMTEMTRLIKRVEELEAPENPGDTMELCIEDVDPILPTPNYHRRLLDGISRQQGYWSDPSLREAVGETPMGKRVPKGTPPEAHARVHLSTEQRSQPVL
jgi:hypothetical protein